MFVDSDRFADSVALMTDDGAALSYRELYDRSAAVLAGVPSRSLLFVLCANRLEPLCAYLGALKAGVVPLLLDAKIDRTLLERLIGIYRPNFIFAPDASGTYALRRLSDAPVALHPDLALLLTTSGSTGSQKLVRISSPNLSVNTRQNLEHLGIRPGDRGITTMPMNYTYGLSYLNMHFAAGATVLLTDRPAMDRGFWDFLSAGRATNFAGVPYFYGMLDRLMFVRRELPDLRLMMAGGGKLPDVLHRKFADHAAATGRQFVIMYGQCEATTTMGYLRPDLAQEKVGAMGGAIPGGSFALIDDDGREIGSADRVGELVYRGANVAMGYAEYAADLVRGDDFEGVLRTGDMAKRDADGCYYIVGRKKRFLKIFGNRVNLDDTERLIASVFPDLDVACIGKDDLMQIFVTDSRRAGAVREFVSEKTHLHPSAFKVELTGELPRNPAGKVLYGELERGSQD